MESILNLLSKQIFALFIEGSFSINRHFKLSSANKPEARNYEGYCCQIHFALQHLLWWTQDFFKELFNLVHICFHFTIVGNKGWMSPRSQVLKVCWFPVVQYKHGAGEF